MTLHGEDLARVGGALGEKYQAVGERGNTLEKRCHLKKHHF